VVRESERGRNSERLTALVQRGARDSRAPLRQTLITVDHVPTLGPPKTAGGRRTVSLDAVTVTALREHRKRQLAERLQLGRAGRITTSCFVASTAPCCIQSGSRTGSRTGLVSLGYQIRLHDPCHGWATMALAAGVHRKVGRERLGHASISITLDTYSHVTTGLHDDAAERVAGLVFGGR
jgi:integrase